MNGLKWTQYPRYAGIYFCNKRGERIKLLDFEYNEKDSISNSIIKYNDGEIRISLFENKICVQSNTPFCLEYDYVDLLEDESISIKTDKTVRFTKREFEYEITLSKGTIVGNKIYSEEGEISINF